MGSEIDNPYAPPKTDRLDADRRLDSPDQAWRDRKLLVVRKKGAVLPDRCLKCNAPAEGYLFTRDISWIRPMWVLLVLLSPLLFILVYFFVRWTGKVSVGLCPGHRQARRRMIMLGWLIALSGFGAFGLATVLRDNGAIASVLTGFGLLIAGVVVGVLGSRVLLPTKIDQQFVWLAKVSPDYLGQFRDFNV
jgi:hypothetical protein